MSMKVTLNSLGAPRSAVADAHLSNLPLTLTVGSRQFYPAVECDYEPPESFGQRKSGPPPAKLTEFSCRPFGFEGTRRHRKTEL
jgi:hypothetical protein